MAKPKRRRWTLSDLAAIRARVDAGEPQADVARSLGLHRQYVGWLLEKAKRKQQEAQEAIRTLGAA